MSDKTIYTFDRNSGWIKKGPGHFLQIHLPPESYVGPALTRNETILNAELLVRALNACRLLPTDVGLSDKDWNWFFPGELRAIPPGTYDFNIWDDYDAAEDYWETVGSLEGADAAPEVVRRGVVAVVMKGVLQFPDVNAQMDHDGGSLTFIKLSHERRRQLVDELVRLHLVHEGRPIRVYSES